jgi:hypothetical protein
LGSFRVPLLPLLHFQARRLGLLLSLCEGLLALLLSIVELFGGLGVLLLQLSKRLLGGGRLAFGMLKGGLDFCTSHVQLLLQGRLGLLCGCESRTCLFDFLAQGIVLCTLDLGNLLQARLFCFVGLLTCLECRTHLGEGIFESDDGMCEGIHLFLELLVGLNEM